MWLQIYFLHHVNLHISSFFFSILQFIFYLNFYLLTIQTKSLIDDLLKNICIMDIEAGAESEFNANKFETNYEDNLEFKVTYNKLLLLGPHSTK